MNIIVFIKQVADTEARILISGDRKSLEIENKYAMNFFDEFAVEEALRLREKVSGTQVTVCTYGGSKAVEALKTAIAMGADRAFLLDGTGYPESDPLFIAEALAAFAKKEGFDLILAGKQAIDDEFSAIGPMIAEFLSIPHVTAVTRVEAGEKLLVEHDGEGGKETLEAALPVLLTTQKGLNEPRVPLITGVMKAMKATVPVVSLPSLGIEGTASSIRVLSYEAPPKRPAVKIAEGETPGEKVKNLVRLLKDEARVL